MKFDVKKTPSFKATTKPEIIFRPEMRALTISGMGDPNQAAFGVDIEAMYTFAYGIKMAYKKSMANQTDDESLLTDYVVPPLEGYWTISEAAQAKGSWDKSDLVYRLELVIPDAVPESFIKTQMSEVLTKKAGSNPRLSDVALLTLPAETVAHILHKGPYDDEPVSFDKLNDYLTTEGYVRSSKNHREIYLSDARRTAPEKLKTILEVAVSN